jgi:hypothetical protein
VKSFLKFKSEEAEGQEINMPKQGGRCADKAALPKDQKFNES